MKFGARGFLLGLVGCSAVSPPADPPGPTGPETSEPPPLTATTNEPAGRPDGGDGGDAAPGASDGASNASPVVSPTRIALMDGATCAISPAGRVKCWGSGAHRLGHAFEGVPAPDGHLYNNVGDQPGEMGVDLPSVELGTNRTAVSIGAAWSHVCALLDDGTVKCWGKNTDGQLGQGDVIARGEDQAMMGNALLPVDLGRKAVMIGVGGDFNCALLDDGSVKCWGNGPRLGIGTTLPRGDGAGKMGAALPAVDLGAKAEEIGVGFRHACARLVGASVKCWGLDQGGSLGQGPLPSNNQTIGDQPGEMGAGLHAIDLGAGRTAKRLFLRGDVTCVVRDDLSTLCWGGNSTGLPTSRPPLDIVSGRRVVLMSIGGQRAFESVFVLDDGSVHEEDPFRGFGIAMRTVDLGSGLKPTEVATSEDHACMLFANGKLKCWGDNTFGQLGIGSFGARTMGTPSLMGNALPNVDVGP